MPGYREADTVAHCGDSMSGEFLWSLTAVDRLLGWTENRAVWNKLAKEVVDAIDDIEKALPFTLKGPFALPLCYPFAPYLLPNCGLSRLIKVPDKYLLEFQNGSILPARFSLNVGL